MLETKVAGQQMAPNEAVLSRQMMDYWGNFAKTGDPNGDGLAGESVFC